MTKIKSIDRHPTDEKQQKALALVERFCLVSDGSGHRYTIPVYLKVEFERWDSVFESEGEEMYNEDPNKFDEYRLDDGMLTFTDPKVS